MNFFRKIFDSESDSKPFLPKPDIESLLLSDNTNNSIIEIDNYIGALCDYGNNIQKLNPEQLVFYFNQSLEREVNNGGFKLFFFNSAGDFAHETVASLKAIGAETTADILQKAIDPFPHKTVSKNTVQRRKTLKTIESFAGAVWEDADQQFYNYEDDLNRLNIVYIRQNKASFIHG